MKISTICKHLTKLRIKVKILEERNSEFDLLRKKFTDLENKLNEIGLNFSDKENVSINCENDSSNCTDLSTIKVEPADEGEGQVYQISTENEDSLIAGLIAVNSGIENGTNFEENSSRVENLDISTKIQDKFAPNTDRTVIVSLKRISNSEIQNYLKKSQKPSGQKMVKGHKCKICGKIISQSSNLTSHMRTHTGEKPYKCSKCQRSFARRDNLKSHILVHSDSKIFSCKVCQKRFKREYSWRRHSIVHTGNGYKYPKNEIFPHLQGKHARNGHKDEADNLSFDQKLASKNLQIESIGAIEDQGKSFGSKIKKRYKCEICERSFYFKYKLEIHLVTHSDLRPFECLVCKKSFKRKDVLLAHSRLHSNKDELFKCPKCPCVYNSLDALKRHISHMHKDLRPFECSVCKKSFKRKDSLLTHSRLHNKDEELFKCSKCPCVYNRQNDLKKHIFHKHKEEDPKVQIPVEVEKKRRMKNELHTCQICLAVFSKPSKLDEHLSTIHPN